MKTENPENKKPGRGRIYTSITQTIKMINMFI